MLHVLALQISRQLSGKIICSRDKVRSKLISAARLRFQLRTCLRRFTRADKSRRTPALDLQFMHEFTDRPGEAGQLHSMAHAFDGFPLTITKNKRKKCEAQDR